LKAKENWELGNEEKITVASSLKEKGTKYFKVWCFVNSDVHFNMELR